MARLGGCLMRRIALANEVGRVASERFDVLFTKKNRDGGCVPWRREGGDRFCRCSIDIQSEREALESRCDIHSYHGHLYRAAVGKEKMARAVVGESVAR